MSNEKEISETIMTDEEEFETENIEEFISEVYYRYIFVRK